MSEEVSSLRWLIYTMYATTVAFWGLGMIVAINWMLDQFIERVIAGMGWRKDFVLFVVARLRKKEPRP